jgi:anti-sigma-K factor RskA
LFIGVMRSADIRASLLRVAGLRQKVFSTVKTSDALGPRKISYWRLVIAVGIVLTLLLVGAWYAGRQSADLEEQRMNAELNRLAQQVAATQLALKQQKAQTDQLQKMLTVSGKNAALSLQAQLRQQLLQAQADANQYKSIIEREQHATAENSRLLEALSVRGTRLLPLKGSESAAESTAYALLVENSKLVFVASNLPSLAAGSQFQLWVVRKQEPKVVSAAVFSRDDNGSAVVSFEDPSVLTDVAQIQVTEEPEGGSSAPTGIKLLEGSNAGGETGGRVAGSP